MNAPSPRIAGITLVELLVTVSVLAVLVVGAVRIVHGIPEASALTKLENDIVTLNQAIDVYRTFGGSMDAVRTPQEVLARLQTKADARSSQEIAGLTGTMIDPRLAAVMQTPSEGRSSNHRAVWNASLQRFEIAREGSQGVKYFALDETLASNPAELEARNAGMKLATRDKWIWDYSDRKANGPGAPTLVPTGVANPTAGTPDLTLPSPVTPPGPEPLSGPNTLQAPAFSIPSGKFPVTQFALSLTLSNPNPAGVSRIVYATNSGGWTVYDGSAITVSPGHTITAYAEAIDADWSNSAYAKERYGVTPVELAPPRIVASATQFDFSENKIIEIALTNPNDPAVSELEFRVSGTPWETYDAPFRLHVDDNPIGAVIEARATPTQPYYTESDVAYTNIDKPAPWFSISGSAAGIFSNPHGGRDMTTNLPGGQTSEFFTWGVPSGTDDPSSLLYTGATFFDISPGERFLIGALDYYNGTIRSSSGASSVDLAISLAFGDSVTETFDFTLELINTLNNTGTKIGNADFVMLGTVASQAPTTIDGHNYNLILEFGETTSNGFATINQFHVFEDATATGNVYARLELAD